MVKNLLRSALAVLVGVIIGALIGHFLNMFQNSEAFQFKLHGGGIDTAKLVAYDAVVNAAMLLGAVFGFVAAQVTYVLDRLQEPPSA
ncbi:MAG: hypothetical protein NTW87_29560 [Planctomycetota bacterium]|nr:hypothetical protein [Planctomycetota bacterium]